MSIEDKYILARWAYAIGEDFIDDAEYTYVEKLIKQKGALSEYVNRS